MSLSPESKTNIKNYLHPFDIVYVGVGCALNPININENNIDNSPFTQQNLKCLSEYNTKLYILIDPELNNICLGSNGPQVFFDREIHNMKVYRSKDCSIKEVPCTSLIVESKLCLDCSLTVLAIKESIDYDKDFDILKFICEFVLIYKKKMIMQDFSGRDPTFYYLKLIKQFGKERMLENIVFDITQMYEGNCFPDVETLVITDTNGNFIQSKYDKNNINTFKDYWSMLRNLAYMMRDPTYMMRNPEEPHYNSIKTHYNSIKICVAFVIYDIIDFDFEFNIQEITKLFHIIVNKILSIKNIRERKEELVNGLLSDDEKTRTDTINKFALIMK